MLVKRWIVAGGVAAGFLGAATPGWAQYGSPRTPDPATGEKYHFELTGLFWQPSPDMVIASSSLGIPGTPIDFSQDLGIEEESFYEVRLVLRPARKHKFRADYTPIKYTADKVLEKDLVFNGIEFRAGVQVNTEVKWTLWNLFYEYDFVYRDRGFAGVLIGAKYTDVQATLTSPTDSEYTKAKGPIPAVGGIGRVYFAPNISVTGQVTLFDMPDEVAEDWNGDMYDIDVYGTINFTNNFGVVAGYRSFEIDYRVELDSGSLDLDGWYVGGVVRF